MTQKPIPRLITLQALTFLHPGTGQSTGVVDLPIQREVHTRFPMYASSGLKGALRDKAEQQWGKDNVSVTTVFGSPPDVDKLKLSAGSINVTDARILAFPVRSLQQVFVWITCPMVIQRLLRDAALINLPLQYEADAIQHTINENRAIVTSDSLLKDTLVLEEVAFETRTADEIGEMIGQLTGADAGFDGRRLAVISNDDFQYLVRYATQISARIKLNERKTTTGDGGNLWYEETLPPETMLYSLVLCHTPRNGTEGMETAQHIAEKLQALCEDHYLQIGGNETVGQGWCRVNLTGDGS